MSGNKNVWLLFACQVLMNAVMTDSSLDDRPAGISLILRAAANTNPARVIVAGGGASGRRPF
jgi:predicted component of type VI protein secretion system